MYNKNNISPDLFLLDVMLPDGNGIDVCNELNLFQGTSSIPVFMMSANADLNHIVASCNAKGFIPKPFDIKYMLDTVNSAISA